MMKVMSKFQYFLHQFASLFFFNLNFIQLNMNPIVFSWIRIKFKLSSMLFNIFIQMKEVTKICKSHSNACTHEGSSIFFLFGEWGKGFLGFFFPVPNVFPWGSLSPQVVPQDVFNYASDLSHMVCPNKLMIGSSICLTMSIYEGRLFVCFVSFVLMRSTKPK
jgi:hypothetical protein